MTDSPTRFLEGWPELVRHPLLWALHAGYLGSVKPHRLLKLVVEALGQPLGVPMADGVAVLAEHGEFAAARQLTQQIDDERSRERARRLVRKRELAARQELDAQVWAARRRLEDLEARPGVRTSEFEKILAEAKHQLSQRRADADETVTYVLGELDDAEAAWRIDLQAVVENRWRHPDDPQRRQLLALLQADELAVVEARAAAPDQSTSLRAALPPRATQWPSHRWPTEGLRWLRGAPDPPPGLMDSWTPRDSEGAELLELLEGAFLREQAASGTELLDWIVRELRVIADSRVEVGIAPLQDPARGFVLRLSRHVVVEPLPGFPALFGRLVRVELVLDQEPPVGEQVGRDSHTFERVVEPSLADDTAPLVVRLGRHEDEDGGDVDVHLGLAELLPLLISSNRRRDLLRGIGAHLPADIAFPSAKELDTAGDPIGLRRYGEQVLNGGPRVLVVGPTGSGRSTLLRSIADRREATRWVHDEVGSRADSPFRGQLEARMTSQTQLLVWDDAERSASPVTLETVAALTERRPGLQAILSASPAMVWRGRSGLDGWTVVPIRRLNHQRIGELLDEFCDPIAVRFESRAARARAIWVAGGRPGLVVLLLQHLLERAVRPAPGHWIELKLGALDEVVHGDAFLQDARRLLLEPLDGHPPLQLALGALLAQASDSGNPGPATLTELRGWAELGGVEMDTASALRCLEGLALAQLAEERDGGWRLAPTGATQLIVRLIEDPLQYLEEAAQACPVDRDGRLRLVW